MSVRLEGCAESNGPAPLTQIHFQALAPMPGGGTNVEVTSQPFEIPDCGVGGASGSTVSAYHPINLCVAQGDFVDFNDEGGFVAARTVPALPGRRPLHGDRRGGRRDDGLLHRQQRVGNGATFSPALPPTTTASPPTRTRS